MAAPRKFERRVVRVGQPTETTLSDVLGKRDDDEVDNAMQEDLDKIREAELRAERQTAEVRLY